MTGSAYRFCNFVLKDGGLGPTSERPRYSTDLPPPEDLFDQLSVFNEADKSHPWLGLGSNELKSRVLLKTASDPISGPLTTDRTFSCSDHPTA